MLRTAELALVLRDIFLLLLLLLPRVLVEREVTFFSSFSGVQPPLARPVALPHRLASLLPCHGLKQDVYGELKALEGAIRWPLMQTPRRGWGGGVGGGV